jgi:hypothetical protein
MQSEAVLPAFLSCRRSSSRGPTAQTDHTHTAHPHPPLLSSRFYSSPRLLSRPPGNISAFAKVHTLILDKNGLQGVGGFPKMPSVTTLWFNNNEVNDIVEFMDEVQATFPNVTYLSCMRNPASPPLVCVSEEDVAASSRFRLYVVHRLPKLQFLDASPVTAEERKEATARGQFLAVRKPKQKSVSALNKPTSPSAAAGGGGVFGAL